MSSWDYILQSDFSDRLEESILKAAQSHSKSFLQSSEFHFFEKVFVLLSIIRSFQKSLSELCVCRLTLRSATLVSRSLLSESRNECKQGIDLTGHIEPNIPTRKDYNREKGVREKYQGSILDVVQICSHQGVVSFILKNVILSRNL